MSETETSQSTKNLWSDPWNHESVARQQLAGALHELGDWMMGKPHPAFGAFVEHVRFIEKSYDWVWESGKIGEGIVPEASFLEVGSGPGYYGAILRVAWHNSSETEVTASRPGYLFPPNYSGVDISEEAAVLAKEVFGLQVDQCHGVAFPGVPGNNWDIVCSSSVLLHIENWQEALREQIRVCRRWLMLHRTPISAQLTKHTKRAYGQKMCEWHFPKQLLLDAIPGKLVHEATWSRYGDEYQSTMLFDLEAK